MLIDRATVISDLISRYFPSSPEIYSGRGERIRAKLQQGKLLLLSLLHLGLLIQLLANWFQIQ